MDDKSTYLNAEINTWKQKFIELNRDHHQNLEDHTMAKAELD